MDIIPWILFVFAASAAAFFFVQLSDLRKRLAEIESKPAVAEGAEAPAAKIPVAAASNVGAVTVSQTDALGDAEKRLHASLAEVKRLESLLVDAEQQIRLEREKSETALAKANTAEAMVSQTRSRATEAGHAALQEARQETEAVRSQLKDAEKRLMSVADPEKRMGELVAAAKRAEAEAASGAERVKILQTEADVLRAKLVQAEASANAATFAATAARAEIEKSARDQFEEKLKDAQKEFEKDVQARLGAERDRFEAERRRMALELDQLRLGTGGAAAAALPATASDQEFPVRTRVRSTASPMSTEVIGSDEEKPLVIVADSDPNATKTIVQHLESGGYAVRSTKTVADAMAALRTTSPVAIALDSTNLPDGDCWSVLASVKEDPEMKEIPVLVFAPSKDKERAMDMGAAGCFSKPIDKAVLVATIKAAMVKRKQRARLAAVSGGASAVRRKSLLTDPS